MVTRKLNKKKLITFILVLIISILLIISGFILKGFSSVSKKEEYHNFEVTEGSTGYQVIDKLEKEGLIRNAFLLKVYSKISGKQSVRVGIYKISTDMNSIEILELLNSNNSINTDETTLNFYPGENVRDLTKKVTTLTNITEEEFISTLKDKTYLKKLINKYWFLTDEILNDDIYYSLEGYLYPDSYSILKTYKSEDIIEMLLNNTDKKLSQIKSKIETSEYSLHEVLTLASIVTLESGGSSDSKKIAGVFINRLNNNWSLGSDVTTYYAAKVNLADRDLTNAEINNCNNKYNTRCSGISLPVGPICNPLVTVITDVLNPEKSEYYYFVSDKNKKIYYSKTLNEHEETIRNLKKEGLWYEY